VKRSTLRIAAQGSGFVVKDSRCGTYCKIGASERFLLEQLDGHHDRPQIAKAYEQQFGETIDDEDLEGFFEVATKHGLVESPDAKAEQMAPPRTRGNSLLIWRRSLYDPDRLFTWLAPKIAFFWTRTFVACSAAFIVAAGYTLLVNGDVFANHFANMSWGTFALGAFTLLAVTCLHECAHGLTCKHFGGEVHEVGFLLLYFMPAFFCNVSDSWLMPRKRHRLAVMFAGGYFELCLWALAVFVWRVTRQDSVINYLAWMVVSICGVRVFFNFIPFLKLDGYYLLSDAIEIPNMRQRALEYVAAYLRCGLWGAQRPICDRRHAALVSYGITCWIFSIVFLTLMLIALGNMAQRFIGSWGLLPIAVLGLVAQRSMLRGLGAGEVRRMLATRSVRTALWGGGVLAVGAALYFVTMEKRASGTFEIRPSTRVELRAPVAGFLRTISVAEGDHVSPSDVIGYLEIPELPSRIEQQRAIIREAEARLHLLQIGPRKEEIDDAQQRLERAEAWHQLAASNLQRNKLALNEDLARLDQRIGSAKTALEHAKSTLERAVVLRKQNVVSPQQFDELQKQVEIDRSSVEQALLERQGRADVGVLQWEDDLARRAKECAEAKAALDLLLAGSRKEEIDAAEATLARAKEELAFLEEKQGKLELRSSVAGTVVTPHLNEKSGQFFDEGALVCEIQEASVLEAEIALPEQQVSDVQPGQEVTLKARALPFETFEARVDRIAPIAKTGQVESTVTVYSRLDHPSPELRPGMTGYARVYCGPQPIGKLGLDYVLRFIRTEYWW
ncbi:MAG TPA: efflux RND transporter periplasmic adaptor subunit, partial [Pirellulales bacterium]|nr:efflux RND transporter periplasmic adaptor subunit [Pirellulales bacterium]